mgnify:CR=1 FL=1
MKRDTTIRIFSLLIALFLVVPAVQAALTVDAGDDRIALAGEPITILATYNDTDVFDALNMSASVNWSTATTAPEIVPDDDYNGTIQDVYTYSAAGTYVVTVKVANNATGAVACDTLNVTVSPQSAEVKVVPKTLNQKSNGLMTIFVDLAEWLGFGDSSSANVTVPDPSEFRIGNATPERVNFCMKDGGTLILKYKRQDLDLAAGACLGEPRIVEGLRVQGHETVVGALDLACGTEQSEVGAAVGDDGDVRAQERGPVDLVIQHLTRPFAETRCDLSHRTPPMPA